MRTIQQTPTREQLDKIVGAAHYFIRTAYETDCVVGQVETPGADSSALPPPEVILAIRQVEKVLNPGRIPFGAPDRNATVVSKWPDVMKLSRELRRIRTLHDGILTSWGIRGLCEGKRLSFFTPGVRFGAPPREDEVRIEVNPDKPLRIEPDTLAGMSVAAKRVCEVVDTTDTADPDKGKKPGKTKDSLRWLADALVLRGKHRDWTNARIAEEVGIHPSALSRSKAFQLATEDARGELAHGYITINPDGKRNVEACSDKLPPVGRYRRPHK